ncbi:unnamed protein product [Prorocentrum cordatum]|uniref:Uncharacterized protein n=1 Tax=Prorocentrum cordatum TaxID=2364126 RepID=A0ABN9Y6C4_9DINO|nr:unnamed protein product [Polarella glacialis]
MGALLNTLTTWNFHPRCAHAPNTGQIHDSSVTAPPGNAAPPVIKRVNGKTATIAPGSNCCLEKIVLPWSPSRSSKLSLNVACISPPRPASSIPSCNQDSKPWNLADASGSTSFASTDGVAWKEPAENPQDTATSAKHLSRP